MKTQKLYKPRGAAKRVVRGSDNVFADLGFGGESRDLLVKAELTRQLSRRIKSLSLTQVDAAGRLGVGQPDVSKLMNGRYTGFSVERLLDLLTALQVDVDIVVKPLNGRRHGGVGSVRVVEVGAA